MSYRVKVLKDNPIGFWPLDESSGTTAFDSSGCGNDGTYTSVTLQNLIPLVMGGTYSVNINNLGSISLPITKNFYGTAVSGGGFGNIKTSDNDFSLEVWFRPNITTSNRTTIFADETNGIGIYYENSNIVFRLNNEELYYNLNSRNKVFHLVATYSTSSMQIFVDGILASSKSISDFKFTNSTTGPFKIGPTLNASDSFLVEAPAVYRYALSDKKVESHYSYGIYHVNAFQIVNQDNGFFFSTHEENLKPSYVHEFNPEQVQLGMTTDTYYENNRKYIGFNKSTGEKSLVLFDTIMLPSTLSVVSSKIEWQSDKNIVVQMGTDGTTYPYTLTNNSYLPLYNKAEALGNRIIYLKVTFTTLDASKYFPKFLNLRVKFYSTKDLYSDNSKYFITSDSEYDIASFNYPTLIRMDRDGIQTSATGGFKINCNLNINTLEFFYNPSALTASTLINNTSANLSWNGSGVISKTNIAAIYVNGVDRSSATSVSSIFSSNQIHHVVIRFTSAITGDIKFNYNTSGGPSNSFNNIAIYQKALSSTEAIRHYSEYTSRPLLASSDSVMNMTDNGINYANSEWIVISTR